MNNEILERFAYCPVCGSKHFDQQNFKSKKCQNCGFEYYTNPSAATAAFIINNEGQLLVLTRKKEPAKGTLDLPGGFCDIGETLEQGNGTHRRQSRISLQLPQQVSLLQPRHPHP